ncbi:MAG: hypothetical protein COV35_10200 [Alphaproteobacteria bacterium CG11_big_fil_rev_8_21_14_0_20_39_49]|nr:MAG: hypothetical protein COV35_10200 [Alphaproteobacteria bacterium CG11_big_fil_rev_8_21_14_0_20_39_49]
MKQDNPKEPNQKHSWLQKLLENNSNKQDPLETSLSDSSRTEKAAGLDESIRTGLNASDRAKLSEENKSKTHAQAIDDQRSKITAEEAMWFGS